MIALLLADGFEEIEALTPLDVLRRMGAQIKTVGITGKIVTGAHGISVIADIEADGADADSFTHLILPGGMPGAANLDSSELTDRIISAVMQKGGHIGAICAAPFILGKRGLLKGKQAVCYPGFENQLVGALIDGSRKVVTDGNITTAKGMGVALPFSKELVRHMLGKSEADIAQLSSSIMEI